MIHIPTLCAEIESGTDRDPLAIVADMAAAVRELDALLDRLAS